ncbi:developmental regulator FlbA [Pseudozyma hubeiensis SY62]|uniref:Developmental regulator FlbA n=1 Tax=Pseudozyma hubeiensis (strain SY62) TaxID=1305764 RepID=R9P3P7_PSEHS|nr:developmental regulator FlbA [Pseudozyma hubeiensis SY62]GAC96078.1 developmental regulator FlbA [Pseudozyma hubeiensis SY62]
MCISGLFPIRELTMLPGARYQEHRFTPYLTLFRRKELPNRSIRQTLPLPCFRLLQRILDLVLALISPDSRRQRSLPAAQLLRRASVPTYRQAFFSVAIRKHRIGKSQRATLPTSAPTSNRALQIRCRHS